MYLLWLSSFKRQLKTQQILDVINETKFWQSQVVKPIRETRQTFKKTYVLSDNVLKKETYSDLLELELTAEKLAQKQLFGDGIARSTGYLASTKESAAKTSLFNYIEILDGSVSTSDIDSLLSVIKED
jgi:hypothetical protein|tara:strand:+ start:52825 stop:53208 length:384 start_codon:yes stop_codon:yes gene_type:complete